MFYNKDIFKRCFPYKGRYFLRNVTGIVPYFKTIHHLVKNGYDDYAVWETAYYFMDVMHSALQRYSLTRTGTPVLVENYPPSEPKTDKEKWIVEENEAKWNYIINRMIELLELMDERNPIYKNKDCSDSFSKMNAAKDEFFELFSKYFYNLWD